MFQFAIFSMEMLSTLLFRELSLVCSCVTWRTHTPDIFCLNQSICATRILDTITSILLLKVDKQSSSGMNACILMLAAEIWGTSFTRWVLGILFSTANIIAQDLCLGLVDLTSASARRCLPTVWISTLSQQWVVPGCTIIKQYTYKCSPWLGQSVASV